MAASASRDVMEYRSRHYRYQDSYGKAPGYMSDNRFSPGDLVSVSKGTCAQHQGMRPPGQLRPPISRRGDEQEFSTYDTVDRIKSTMSLQELEELLQPQWDSMRPIDVASAITHLAQQHGTWGSRQYSDRRSGRQYGNDDASLQRLLEQLGRQLHRALHHCSARQAANILWSWGKLEHGSADALGACLGRFCAVLHDAEPQHVSSVLWALGKLSESRQHEVRGAVQAAFQQEPDAVRACLHHFHCYLADASPQQMAIVVWALAKLAVSGQSAAAEAATAALQQEPHALQACIGRFCAALAEASSQHIANLLWALAKLRVACAAEQVQLLLEQLAYLPADVQHISNALWALSELRQLPNWRNGAVVDQHTVRQLLYGFLDNLGQADNQHVSNYLLAIARLNAQQPATAAASPRLVSRRLARECLLEVVESIDLARVGSFIGQHIGNCAWACGELGVCDEPFLGALEEAALHSDGQGGLAPQNVSSLALAVAKLRYSHAARLVSRLLDLVASQVAGPGGAVSAAAAAAAAAGGGGGAGGGFGHQHLANLCWAAAVADVDLRAEPRAARQLRLLCEVLLRHWDVSLRGGQRQQEHLRQLFQMHMWLWDSGQASMLPEQQLRQCEDAWLAASPKAAHTDFQRQVLSAVRRMEQGGGWGVQVLGQQDAVTDDGLVCMDIAAQLNGQKLAIQVHGPSHFTFPYSSGRLNGQAAFKNRALAARGCAVVSIPWYEWEGLGPDEEAGYLAEQMQAAVADAVGRVGERRAGGAARRLR